MTIGRSLHIGLNAIDPKEYGTDGRLRGCENDARDMRAIANAAGFTSEMLLTKEATSTKVLERIADAAKALQFGDTFLLTLACHGSQLPDLTGDEADKLDETWLLYDRMLIDDEIHNKLSQFRTGVRVVVCSDSCHSGTVTRAMLALQKTKALSRSQPSVPVLIPRCVPHEDLADHIGHHLDLYKTIKSHCARIDRAVGGPTVLLLSGCQDDQTSGDGIKNGFFTENLKAVWQNGSFAGDYDLFHTRIVKSMEAARPSADQTPNLLVDGPDSTTLRREKPFHLAGRTHQEVSTEGLAWRNGNGVANGNGHANVGRFVIELPIEKLEIAITSPQEWRKLVAAECLPVLEETGLAVAQSIATQRQVRNGSGVRGEFHAECKYEKGEVSCKAGASWRF